MVKAISSQNTCKWLLEGEKRLNEQLEAIEEALLNHSRPTQVAFHFYELLSVAGYDDEYISEVATAMEDIVA